MPAWVCRRCGETYPPSMLSPMEGCRFCDGPLVYDPFGSVAAEGLSPDEIEFPLLNAELQVREDAIVISSTDMVNSGFTNPPAGTIFRVAVPGFPDQVWHIEILDYSYTHRIYLVREFKVEAPDYVPKDWVKPKRRKKKES